MPEITLDMPLLETHVPAPTETPQRPPFPKRPKRRLKIDADLVVRSVEKRAGQIAQDRDRGLWLEARLQRYAKYRGWLQDKTWPWPEASNVHPPLLQIAELRANAGLHNVVMTMRPLFSARATKRVNVPKEDRISELLDTQLFLDPGPEMAERRFGDFVSAFLQDGNAVAYTPWVRDEREIITMQYRPGPPPGADPFGYVEGILAGPQGLFPTATALLPDGPQENRYRVQYQTKENHPAEARVEVFADEQEDLEFIIRSDEVIYDGPVMLNVPVSALLIPTRCENLQPPSEFNPNGAPSVFLTVRYRIDEIKRLKDSNVFNWLDETSLAAIIAQARADAGIVSTPKESDRIEQQKDEIEGRVHSQPPIEAEEDVNHLSVPLWMCFDRWEVDGEVRDVFWMIAKDAKVLCEARLLTERWPSTRPYRPLAEAIAIPVPGRWYGISFLELGEALYDLIKGTIDMSFDAGAIANLPFFFYTANAAFRAETVRLAPGEGYPVPGDPRSTIYIPQMQSKDQTWAFNTIGMGVQMFEKLMSIGDLQLGRVATGKASALRTFGTTLAILQQGDVRADQLLLRLFSGLRQIARNFHAMNRHLLPAGREIRILGFDGPREQGYQTIDRIEDIDAEVEFDFRPDFLLSNPAVLNQALQSVLAMVATPLAFQVGITDPQLFYNTTKDFVRSLRLDPKKYVKPPMEPDGPPLLAEEAIDLVLQDTLPQGVPMEGAEAHMKKLFAFVNSDQFGHLQPQQVALFRAWLQQVGRSVQQAQAVGAAREFQGQMQQQGGTGGVPTTMQEPPQTAAAQGAPVSAATGLEPAG